MVVSTLKSGAVSESSEFPVHSTQHIDLQEDTGECEKSQGCRVDMHALCSVLATAGQSRAGLSSDHKKDIPYEIASASQGHTGRKSIWISSVW